MIFGRRFRIFCLREFFDPATRTVIGSDRRSTILTDRGGHLFQVELNADRHEVGRGQGDTDPSSRRAAYELCDWVI